MSGSPDTNNERAQLIRRAMQRGSGAVEPTAGIGGGIVLPRRRLLYLGGGGLVMAALAGAGIIATRPKDIPQLTEKEQVANSIRDFEAKAGDSPVTPQLAEAFAPLVVKLYSLTFPFSHAEATQRIKFDNRTSDEIHSAPKPTAEPEHDHEKFIDDLYLTFYLQNINKGYPHEHQYPTMDPTPENIKPIVNLRAKLLHNLMSWQIAKLPKKEADAIFARAFTEIEMERQSDFDRALKQAFNVPNSHFRADVGIKGFDITSDYYDDLGNHREGGGNNTLERFVIGYLCQKIAVDNELTFAQISYDFDPEEFSEFRGIIEGRARLNDLELFGMILNSDVPGFINRINQVQTGVKFTDQLGMQKFWIGAFHNPMNRSELWVKLTHAFPGTKTPSIVLKGYR